MLGVAQGVYITRGGKRMRMKRMRRMRRMRVGER
jgi:hypothetical protein